MLPASLGILAALSLVLGLMALGVWGLKRMGAVTSTSKGRLAVEVVQRLPLGPKSGLVVVRVGEKVLAVSIGDGGVHTLFEVDESDRQRVLAQSDMSAPHVSSATAESIISRSIQGALRGPLQKILRRRGGADVSSAQLESFANTMSRALEEQPAGGVKAVAPLAAAEMPPVPAPTYSPGSPRLSAVVSSAPVVAPVVVAPKAPVKAVHADLRSVLSMTLAPSTRLLSFVALAAVSLLATSPLHAQGEPTGTGPDVPPAAQPVVTPAAQPTVTPAAQPTVTPVAPTPATQTTPTTPTAAPAPAPATGTTGATPARQPTVNPAQPAAASAQAGTPAVEPASAADAIAGMVPQLDLRMGNGPDGGLRLNGTVGVVLMMGLLSMVPTLILMMTGFTRILIVLHFLKQAMGTQSAPPAHLVGALALLLTGFVMAPTLAEANRTAITPWLEGSMEQTEMLKVGVVPFREFMLRQTNEKDLRTFVEMSQMEAPETAADVPLHVLMSAFVASELRTAFQIGFAIYLPFIIIDAVVSSVLMAMGMFMLPPAMISLPFKLLLFVLVDGWSLTIQSLVQSFR